MGGGGFSPRSGTGAVAGSDRCSRRGGGAVLAQAGGGAVGGTDTGAVAEVFVRLVHFTGCLIRENQYCLSKNTYFINGIFMIHNVPNF
jgi:hypothetical protein